MKTPEDAYQMPNDVLPTLFELRALILKTLQGTTESNRWGALVGLLMLVPSWFDSQSNWDVAPSGSNADRAAIAKAVAIVRALHPYVRG